MTRKEEIEKASKKRADQYSHPIEWNECYHHFKEGAEWADMNPMATLDADYAWKVYNFINNWKAGTYGKIPLQKALQEKWKA